MTGVAVQWGPKPCLGAKNRSESAWAWRCTVKLCLCALVVAALGRVEMVAGAGRWPDLKTGTTVSYVSPAGSSTEAVWQISVPASKDLVVTVSTTGPTVAYLSAAEVPTPSSHDAANWGKAGETMQLRLDSCVRLGTEYSAFLRLQCWGFCSQQPAMTWTLRATTLTSSNVPTPSRFKDLRMVPGAKVELSISDVRPGHMRYAFILVPSQAEIGRQTLQVAQPGGLPVQVSLLPYHGPKTFFGTCMSLRAATSKQTVAMGPRATTAMFSLPRTSPAVRGVWLGVTSWSSVSTVALTLSWSKVLCASIATSILPYCSNHLPAEVFTPVTIWPGSTDSALVDRDATARALALVVSDSVGALPSQACTAAVGARACATAFPTCRLDNGTAHVLPPCTAACSQVHEECEQLVGSSARGVISDMQQGCVDGGSDAATCYATFGGSTVAEPGWASILAVVLLLLVGVQ